MKKNRLIYILVGLIFLLQPNIALALSEDDQISIDRDTVWANPNALNENGTPDSCGSTSLSGSDNAEKVYNFLTGKGLTPIQASGVMGNLAVESGYIPNNQQNGSPWPSDGWGIAQWTGSRRDTLASEVKAAGLPYVADKADGGRDLTPSENDALLAFQLDFLYNESNERTMRDNPNKKEWVGLTELNKTGDAGLEEAVIYWEWNFERAGEPALGERLEAAKEAFANFGSGTGGTGSTSVTQVCSGGSSGTLVGGWSLPVPVKFYKSNPDWFTKPHHDYPSADIPVPEGTPVYAVTGGKVESAPIKKDDPSTPEDESDTSYGRGVIIVAPDGTRYIYAHGQDGGTIKGAKEGDTVVAGQLIMHSGNTGNSSGPHLHFEILPEGVSNPDGSCPKNLLKAIGDGASIPSIESLPTSGCTY